MLLEMTVPVQGGLRQEKHLEIIANHVANAGTTGFKADILSFDEMFHASLTTDHRPGSINTTGNELDLAIDGNGFFKVQTARGTRYTRDGNFTLNSTGILTTRNGDPVLGTVGPIAVRTTGDEIGIHIREDGQVQVSVSGAAAVEQNTVGTLAVVTFNNLNLLEKEGDSLFQYTGAAVDEIVPPGVKIRQGALEQANISSAIEMVKMIHTHRMYEAYQKMIQTYDEINAKAITEVAKV
jgi:flagellar basal-body rod protein FlgG